MLGKADRKGILALNRGIPLTGTSVSPARSFGPALVLAMHGNSMALDQVWVFIFAPLVGAAIAAVAFGAFKSFYRSDAERSIEA